MRDDRKKWPALPDRFDTVEYAGVALAQLDLPSQTLVSGTRVLGQFPKAIEWPEIAATDTYALSLRRDQVLIVGKTDVQTGWDAKNSLAVSDVSDGLVVFELSGKLAIEVLQRGAELSLRAVSRSVSRQLFGQTVLLYRHAQETTYRVHVSRPQASGFFFACEHALKAL